MKSLVLLLVLFILPFLCLTQTIIRVKIIDAKTETAIQGVSIILKENIYLTNAKGEAILKKNSNKKVSVVLNHIGYKSQTITIDTTDNVVVKMEQFSNTLPEVVIGTQTTSIIELAIKNIKLNYPQKPFVQDFAIVMLHNTEEKERMAYQYGKINGVIRVRNTPYFKNASIPNGFLINNQISRSLSETNLSDTTRYYNNWYQPSILDIVHSRSLFLDKSRIKEYQFLLTEKIIWNNRLVYNIEFNHKTNKTLQGSVYIDSATYAIVFAKYTNTDIRQLFFRTIEKATYSVSYKLFANKWYMDEATRDANYKLRAKTTLNDGFKAFKTVLIDTLNESPTKNFLLIDQWADVYTLNAKSTDTSVDKYKPYFDSIENEVQHTQLKEDSLIAKKQISGFTKLINNIGKYVASNKVRIGLILTRGQFAFAGLQNQISKYINGSSEYLFGNQLTFSFYKQWVLYLQNCSNYGIGGVNFSQNIVGISTKINAKKFSIQPIVGYSRNIFTDKEKKVLARLNGWVGGFTIFPKRKTRLTPFFSILYYKDTNINKASLLIDNRNFLISLGILLK
jgi:hypothetical protein